MEAYRKEISKETFKGNWPFTIDSGILINNNNAIMFGCDYKRLGVTKYTLFAINGTATTYKKQFKAKRVKRIALSPSKSSVSDIIHFGLKLNSDWEGQG